MSAVAVGVLAILWIAPGAYGVWLANAKMNRMFPGQVNKDEDAIAYLWALGGIATLMGALFWVWANGD